MLKKICSFFSTILMLLLVVIAALLLVPKLFGYTQYAVISGSMEPNIPVGSIVYDKEVEPEELEIGDVITYRLSGDTLVTHRIVAIDEASQSVQTKGDANEAEDGAPVPYSEIVGLKAFHVPLLGYISIYGKTPLGIAAVCGVLVLLILLNFLPDILSEEEEKKE